MGSEGGWEGVSREQEGGQESAVSHQRKGADAWRRRNWQTELNAATRQVAQGLKHILCVGDLHDFDDHQDNGL